MPDFDIIVAGGGAVGASAALGLLSIGYHVALIEAGTTAQAVQRAGGRHLALSMSSRRILELLNAWPADAAHPIEQIHISQQGHFGATRLDGKALGLEALGYTVPNSALLERLYARLRESSVTLLESEVVTGLKKSSELIEIHRKDHSQGLSCKLLVAADGAGSTLRQALGLNFKQKEYGQTAIAASVEMQHEKPHIAYERFSPQGPLALLPLGKNRYAFILTRDQSEIPGLLAQSDKEFIGAAQNSFGWRLGRFNKISPRIAIPLSLIRAPKKISHRAVLIGNAAQSIHPVAAQGLNLALRDMAALIETLIEPLADSGNTQVRPHDPGLRPILASYARWRQADAARTIFFTDFLAHAFRPNFPGMGCLRSSGLVALDCMPGPKRRLARVGLGLHGKPPGMALGISPWL